MAPSSSTEIIDQLQSTDRAQNEKGLDALLAAMAIPERAKELTPRVNQLLVSCTEVFVDIRERLAKEEDTDIIIEYEAIIRECCKAMDHLLRSPVLGPRLTPKSITTYIKAILPLGRHGHKQEMIDTLGCRSLMHNALNRSHLLVVLIRECYSLVRKSKSSIVYLIKQFVQLVKLFEFQLKLRYECGVNPLRSKTSEFANLNLDSLVYETNALLVECGKKRYPALYADSIERLVEELETLLNLLIIYAELSGKCLLDNFILVQDAQNSKAFKYVKEQIDKEGTPQGAEPAQNLPPAADAPDVEQDDSKDDESSSPATSQSLEESIETLDITHEDPVFLNQEIINELEELVIEDRHFLLQEAQNDLKEPEEEVQGEESTSKEKDTEEANDDWVLVDEPELSLL